MHKCWSTRLTAACAILLALITPTLAHAQEDDPIPADVQDASFSIQAFEPALGHDPLLTIESIRSVGHLGVTAGILFGYQHAPFSVFPCEPGTGGTNQPACELDRDDPTSRVVSGQLQADLFATFSLIDMFQIGLAIPIILYQDGDGIPVEQLDGSFAGNGLSNTTSLGDIRLHLKWTAPFGLGAGERDGFGLAIAPVVSFPTGNAIAGDSFMGDGLPTVHAQVLAEYRWRDLQVGARAGYRWREDSTLFSTEVGQQFTYAVGASYDIHFRRAGYGIRPIVELFGANGFSTELDQNPLELDVGVVATLAHDYNITIGGGAGLIAAVGVPQYRLFAGFSWTPQRGDSDRDGVVDRDDQCPNETEDIDGFEDEDGCPDLDNDGDGINDDEDRCPDDAEDFDGYEDEDGCPEPDNDGDGINDGYDTCPDEAEDFDGYEDEDGCPDLDHDGDNIPEPRDHCPYEQEDTDGFADQDGCPEVDADADGINDDEDLCPAQPEDFDGFEDDDGCPDPDNDRDLIPDEDDRCPTRAETWNDQADSDGCPDGRAAVSISEESIQIVADVTFVADTDELTGRASTIVLNSLSNALNAGESLRVTIVVTASTEELAQQRATTIRAYLISRGVGADRLSLSTNTGDEAVSFEHTTEDEPPPPQDDADEPEEDADEPEEDGAEDESAADSD